MAATTSSNTESAESRPSNFLYDIIAEDVRTKKYGDAVIQQEKPIKARLEGDSWWVEGSVPEGRVGGAAQARIAKADGRITYIWHEK